MSGGPGGDTLPQLTEGPALVPLGNQTGKVRSRLPRSVGGPSSQPVSSSSYSQQSCLALVPFRARGAASPSSGEDSPPEPQEPKRRRFSASPHGSTARRTWSEKLLREYESYKACTTPTTMLQLYLSWDKEERRKIYGALSDR